MGTKKKKSVKKVQRIKTKQPGVYKNSLTNKYDVKYCYTIVDMATLHIVEDDSYNMYELYALTKKDTQLDVSVRCMGHATVNGMEYMENVLLLNAFYY